MKIVRFSYPKCSGVITYTGIGAGRDGAATAVHITRWLDGMRDLDIDELTEALRDKGGAWLRRLLPSPFPHTFLVAGFKTDGEAVLAMVSNFQSMNGPTRTEPSSSLTVSVASTRGNAIARVTGVSQAVPRERERLLKRTVDVNALDSDRIKQAMMSVIARAAKSPASANLISAESSVISFLPGGSGSFAFSEPMGVQVHYIMNGSRLPSLRSLIGGRKVVQAAFVGPESAPYHQDRCDPSQYEGSIPGVYDLTELVVPGKPPYSARAIDGTGTIILCSSTIDGNVAYRQYWLYRSVNDVQRIPLPEPTFSDRGGFDANGYVYLTLGLPGQVQRPARWNGTELSLLPRVADYQSTVLWISPSGWLAGSVEVSDDYTRADRQQPARWDPDGRLHRAKNVADGAAGFATSVAAEGTALAHLHRDLGPIQSHVWRIDGSLQPLSLPVGSIAAGITDAHVIVGFREDPRGRTAIVSTDGSNWSLLGTPPSWDPTRVAPDGTVTGLTSIEGFQRPWIRGADGTSMTLPGYRRHTCSIDGISASGVMVGTAHAEFCGHALLWRKLA